MKLRTRRSLPNYGMPRPVRGAWVETLLCASHAQARTCRAPYGARGLKPGTEIGIDEIVSAAPRTGRVG